MNESTSDNNVENKYHYNEYKLMIQNANYTKWFKFNTQKMGTGSQSRVDIYDTPIVIKETPLIELPDFSVIEKIGEINSTELKCLIPTKVRKIGDFMLMSYPRSGEPKDIIFLIRSLKTLHKNNIAYWDLFKDNVVDGWLVDNGLVSWSNVRPHKLRYDIKDELDGIKCDQKCLNKNFKFDSFKIKRMGLFEQAIMFIALVVSLAPLTLILLHSIYWNPNSIVVIIFSVTVLIMVAVIRWRFSEQQLHSRLFRNRIFDTMMFAVICPFHQFLSTDTYLGETRIKNVMDIYNKI